jgi:hypothetical protein
LLGRVDGVGAGAGGSCWLVSLLAEIGLSHPVAARRATATIVVIRDAGTELQPNRRSETGVTAHRCPWNNRCP